MTLAESLLAAALKLAPPSDESHEERRTRFAVIALAVSEVPMPAETLASMLDETGLSPAAHRGEVRGDKGKSWCLGQVNEGNPLGGEHAKLVGTDLVATRRCAEAASKTLVHAREYCAQRGYGAPTAAFSLYATGKVCDGWAEGASRRVALAARIASWKDPPGPKALASLRRVQAAPASCTAVVVIRPPGWVSATKLSRPMVLFARALVGEPEGASLEAVIGGRRLLARVDRHCDEKRGAHLGVSLYEPEAGP